MLCSAEDLAIPEPRANDGVSSCADDLTVAKCPVCGRSFDERAYQVIVWDLGAFDSVECAEKAMRRSRSRSGHEIADALIRAASHLQSQAAPQSPSACAADDR